MTREKYDCRGAPINERQFQEDSSPILRYPRESPRDWESDEADERTHAIEVIRRPAQIQEQQRFLASDRLVTFLINGFVALKEAASATIRTFDTAALERAEQSFDITAPPAEELREAVTTRLERMFATLGFRAAARQLRTHPVTEDSRFTVAVQFELLDRFLVRPDENGVFFDILSQELQVFVRQGGRLGGNWGKLVLRDGDLVLDISPRQTTERDEEWEIATLIGV